MSTQKHTPGPWKVMPEECHRPYIRIRGSCLGARYKVANVLAPDYKDAPEREADETRANAALIAAAPELLEAVRCLTVMGRNIDGTVTIGPRGWEMLQAAILKAEGRK